jgi:hypothetical protein
VCVTGPRDVARGVSRLKKNVCVYAKKSQSTSSLQKRLGRTRRRERVRNLSAWFGLETVRSRHTSHITHHTRNSGPKYAGHGQRPCAEALNRGPGWRSPTWHAVSSADVGGKHLRPPSVCVITVEFVGRLILVHYTPFDCGFLLVLVGVCHEYTVSIVFWTYYNVNVSRISI